MIATVINVLSAVPGVAGVVGERIYAGRSPQEAAFPHLVVAKTSEREPYDLSSSTGFTEARIAIVCRAALAGQAEALGNAVIAALKDFAAGELSIQRDVVDRTDAVDVQGKPIFMRTLGFVVWRSG